MRLWPFLIILFFMGSSCVNRNRAWPEHDFSGEVVPMDYAQGFSIEKQGDISVLKVFNPWQGAENTVYTYVLCPRESEVPASLSPHPVIRTPVERVVCLSTTHIAMLAGLDKVPTIKAISGSLYVSDPAVRQAVSSGQIIDIGYDQALNYERIISLKPDVIFAYGIGKEIAGSLSKLSDLGLKVVFNAEYLEQTALGKAEWIKFMAAFYDCEAQATEKFETIRDEYNALCGLAKEASVRPKILCGLPWQGIWYIPGGNTSTAAMIADAGGDYLWAENDSRESIPVNIETIVNKAAAADYWINTGAAFSLEEIKSVDERLILLQPFQTGMVYNNNARMSANGGNDFFESGIIRPHVILKDMVKIFHPELIPGHELYFYRKLDP